MKIFSSSSDIKYAFIEIFIGLILGIIFGYLLEPNIGALIFGIGVLLSFSRALIFRWFVREFADISECYYLKDKIREIKDKSFIDEALLSEKRFLNNLENIAKGTIRYEGNDYINAAESQIDITKKSMKATALIDPREWLYGELKEYLDRQIKALKKNKKLEIKRLFYLNNNDIKNDAVKKVLNIQSKAGIKVFIINKQLNKIDLPPPFVIYDDQVAIIGDLDREGKIPGGIKTINKIKVRDLINTFEHHRKFFAEEYKATKNS